MMARTLITLAISPSPSLETITSDRLRKLTRFVRSRRVRDPAFGDTSRETFRRRSPREISRPFHVAGVALRRVA
jgi:hypothetical protein